MVGVCTQMDKYDRLIDAHEQWHGSVSLKKWIIYFGVSVSSSWWLQKETSTWVQIKSFFQHFIQNSLTEKLKLSALFIHTFTDTNAK